MAVGRKTGGRQKGTPNKATADVMAVAQQYTAEAIETLAAIMRGDFPAAARVAASSAILDRGHGKPTQAIDLEAHVLQSTVSEHPVTEDEWQTAHALQ